jgi:succinate-acetate transporter protein
MAAAGTVSEAQPAQNGSVAREYADWRASTRVFLQPIARPSILGLFGFAGATFMIAANLDGWFGTTQSGIFLFPFAFTLGGIAQFLAGMWAYRARDGVATAMHGLWGSFWMAYGILWLLVAVKAIVLPPNAAFHAFGYWMIVLAGITWSGFLGALAENLGLAAVLFTLALGSTFGAVFWLGGGHWAANAAAWSWLVSAWLAWYTATALMLESAYGRVILPLGKFAAPRVSNRPGAEFVLPLQFERGEPGVRMGQ